ncbi:MAG TPA: hypothetical protein VGF99_06505 [Myxococcota bacterium]
MIRTLRSALLLVVAVVAVGGCAGLSERVDRNALNAVPNEELLVLFDAENGVYIARDESDLASRTLQDAKLALSRARAYRDVIAERRTTGATIDSVAVLDLLAAWNDERIAMREAEVAWRETELATSDTRLWAARARYEREKARLVKDKNPSAGTGIELARFDEQVKHWATREAEAEAEIAAKNAVVVEKRAKYFDLSRRLQEQSAGAYGGPWADLLD